MLDRQRIALLILDLFYQQSLLHLQKIYVHVPNSSHLLHLRVFSLSNGIIEDYRIQGFHYSPYKTPMAFYDLALFDIHR